MSMPRPIFKGDLYLITRRTNGRRFFLKPTKRRTKRVEYCLAVAAKRYGVQVHAVVVMSNHWHVVATDPHGELPEFLRDAHSWIAKCINAITPRWENLWSSEQTSLVRSEGDDNVVERIIYTMANPVSAGLVAHGKSWPGLRTRWPKVRKRVTRPDFFRDTGPMPAFATLELVRPPGFDNISDELLDELLCNGIERREQYWRDVMKDQGRRFLGRRGVLAQSVWDAPRTHEPRRQISPRVGERNKWRRIEALQRLRVFAERYRRAYELFRAGFRDFFFPAGTYKLQRQAGVLCLPD